jgi:hypothetical protein
MPALTRIQLRRGTVGVGSSQWTNQVLYVGEVGYETDTGRFKVGDGSTLWSSLPYAAVLPSELNESIDDRVDALVVAGSGIVKSYNDSSNTLTLSSPLSAGSGILLGYNSGTYTISLNTSGVDNSKLANSSVTIGLTPVSLGGSITSISGLSSVSSTSFLGNLTGTATNANNIEVDLSTSNVNSLVFVNGTDGNLKPSVNNNLKFDAASNELFGSLNTTPTTTLKYFTVDGGTP